MSWDPYIVNMTASGTIALGAIGTETSIYAHSDGFDVSLKEIKAFSAPPEAMYSGGVFLGGRKFYLLRYVKDDKETYLNLKSGKDENGTTCNATVYKTKTAYVIGVGSADSQGGAVTTDVCKLGEYLITVGY